MFVKNSICTDMGNTSEHNVLIFNLSGRNCAFPLDAVREIVPMARLSSPPGMPSGLAGFLDLRGAAIPIIRLDRLFDLPEQQPGLYTPIIVLRGILAPIGILAASVRGVVRKPATPLLDLPEGGTFHGCAIGAMDLDGDIVHLLSPAALLLRNEDRLVADYSAMTEARRRHLEDRN
jgi:purine-binding chemotaxis protein CheW